MTVLELKGMLDNLVENNRGDYSINIFADKSTICEEGWSESSTFKKLQIEDVGDFLFEEVDEECPCCSNTSTIIYPVMDNNCKFITKDGYVVLHFSS